MERYNYIEQIMADIIDYINCNINMADYADRDELAEFLNDELWTVDSVTGNASGSYFCNAWRAEEAICHNLDLLADACNEWGQNFGQCIERGAEYADVAIRCHLLGTCINAALDELERNGELEFAEEDE